MFDGPRRRSLPRLSEWRIKGAKITNYILNNPSVFGLTLFTYISTIIMLICCNIKNSLNGVCFSSEGKSDVKEYLSKMASCKYFCSFDN